MESLRLGNPVLEMDPLNEELIMNGVDFEEVSPPSRRYLFTEGPKPFAQPAERAVPAAERRLQAVRGAAL